MGSSAFRKTVLCALTGAGVFQARTSLALTPSDFLIFDKGPLSLRPQFDVQESYSDNIFYRDTAVVADMVTQMSPGAVLQLGDTFGENHVRLEYNFDIIKYLDNAVLDANQQRLKMVSVFSFGKFDLSGNDSFQQIATPLTGGISSRGAKIQRTSNNDTWTLGYRISEKSRIYNRGSFSQTDYEPLAGNTLFDQMTLTDTVGLDWKPLSKTTFFTEFQYGRSYLGLNTPAGTTPPSTEMMQGSLGARGDFTSKLAGSIQAGYESRTFSDGSPAGASPTVEMKLTDKITERMTAELSYNRTQSTSVQFDRTSYASDNIQASLLRLMNDTGRLRMQIAADATFNTFDPSKAVPRRSDQIFSASIVLQYSFETWLTAYASFSHETFKSDLPPAANNISLVDYDANRITIGLSVGY